MVERDRIKIIEKRVEDIRGAIILIAENVDEKSDKLSDSILELVDIIRGIGERLTKVESLVSLHHNKFSERADNFNGGDYE